MTRIVTHPPGGHRTEAPGVPSTATSDADEEERILAALDARDLRKALEMSMTAYGDRVYAYCSGLLTDRGQLDDVHQRVFIQAYDGFASFKRGSTVRTWLFAIAKNRCRDANKEYRRARARRSDFDESVVEMAAVGRSADESIDDATIARALSECLAELKAHIRLAVLLRYNQSFSYEYMSSLLNEQSGTLEKRVKRALPLLRECIQKKMEHGRQAG